MIRLALAFLILAVSPPAYAQAPDFEKFGQFIEAFRKETRTPAMSAVIVKDGEIAWEGYFGTYDDEGELPTVADTTYWIASVTKPIAAMGIVAESHAGLLELNTPMTADSRWMEICERFRATPIPFMGGGTDTGGHPIAPIDCEKSTTLAEMLDMRANGDSFVYNPIAYARIDRVISGAGGRDLRAIVRDRVIEPAGMRNVALGWHDPEEGDALRFLAQPYHLIDGRVTKQAISDDDFRAAAGMMASPRSLAAFDRALDAGVIVPPAVLARLTGGEGVGPIGDYRMGWWLEDWNGKRLMWHSGKDDERYSAVYLKVPEDRLTLIVLANTEAIWNEGSSLVDAKVARSPIARRFLEEFVQ